MNGRIAYIDYSKAIAIIMVVTGHICFFNIFNQNTEKTDSLLIIQLLKSIQMPLFIFCSGLVMKSNITGVKDTIKDGYKRFRLLIVPFLIIGMSFAFISDKMPIYFLSKCMKLGYWYLLTLFELYILNYIFIFISNIWKESRIPIVYDILLGGVIFTTIKIVYSGIDADDLCWQNTLSWLQLVRYYPYFVLAILIQKYNRLDTIISNKWLYCIALVTSILILYANSHNIHILGRTFILPIALLISIMHIMKLIEQSEASIIKKCLNYIGKKTLDIYLFHYFVLASFNIPYISNIVAESTDIVTSLLFVLPLVALTISLSILLGNLVRSSKVLNTFIFYK